jgi:hypothetical protein
MPLHATTADASTNPMLRRNRRRGLGRLLRDKGRKSGLTGNSQATAQAYIHCIHPVHELYTSPGAVAGRNAQNCDTKELIHLLQSG